MSLRVTIKVDTAESTNLQRYRIVNQAIAGPAGPAGPTGAAGTNGAAATVSVGSTTTSPAGTSASVTNTGTSSAAVLHFTIPQGATGPAGATGATGPAGPTGAAGASGDRYKTTSSTALTIGNGTFTITVGTGLAYSSSQSIIVSYDPSNHIHGVVTSYNAGSGVLVFDEDHHTGSGTYSAWEVNLDGATGGTGPAGPAGTAATISVGSTTTSAPGTSATVTNAGTSSAAILNFTIPQGATGPAGATGPTGPAGANGAAATVSVGSTTTSAPGTSASVTNSGTSSAAVLNFTIPQGATGSTGATGPAGSTGATGPAGAAATVSVGTTTTTAPGTSATVTNAGTSSAAVLNFTIPQGATGANGTNGTNGTNGAGVNTGGLIGQRLTKNSGTDYDTRWSWTELSTLEAIPRAGSTTLTSNGVTLTAYGTATSASIGTGSNLAGARRLSYVSASTAGSAGGVRDAQAVFLAGNAAGLGGYTVVCTFGLASIPATRRLFVGLTGSTTAITAADPSSFVTCIGVGVDSADTALQFLVNDATGTCTKTASPYTLTANDLYRWTAHVDSNGATVTQTLTKVGTSTTTDVQTTNLPASTTPLAFHFWSHNVTTAAIIDPHLVLYRAEFAY